MLSVLYGFLYSVVLTLLTLASAYETSPQDLKIQTEKCYPNYGLRNYTTGKNERAPGARCMSDEDCAKYGDCCTDSKYFNPTADVSSFTCTLRKYPDDYIYMKKNCHPSWSDTEKTNTSAQCQKSANHDSSEPSLITPVMNIRSKTVYGNIFCAQCNFDARTHEDIKLIGELTIRCNVSNDKVKLKSTGNNFSYNETEGEWHFINENASYPCYLELNITDSSNFRRCWPLIKTCPSTWNNGDIRQQCESNTSVIHRKFERKHLFHRNIHCAICNDESDNLICPEIKTVGPTLSDAYSYLVKVDFPYDKSTTSTSYKPYFSIMTGIGIGISVVCLSIHLIVFAIVEELHNLSGKNLASMCVALLIGYISFFFADNFQDKACVANAITTYYFFLATFFWMLIMSFDIWRMLNVTTKRLIASSGQQWRKFFLYSFCGWTLPAIFVLIAVIVDLYPIDVVDDQFKPHLGQGAVCWFGSGQSTLIYFGVPVLIILLCNLTFFVHCLSIIYTNSNTTIESSNRPILTNVRLYTSLTLIMGMTWIIGYVANYFDNEILWAVFTLLNTSLGLFIFLAFTCKLRVINALKARCMPGNFKARRVANEE